jgi:hypothetical protein
MKSNILLLSLSLVLSAQLCNFLAIQGFDEADSSGEVEPTSSTVIQTVTPDFSFDKLLPATELDPDILLDEIMFYPGGAGCYVNMIGLSDRYCTSQENWPVNLRVNGVFRVSDQINYDDGWSWWGAKRDSCYETFQFGDMIYLSVVGYPEGELVSFTIHGPGKSEKFYAVVKRDFYIDAGICEPIDLPPSARLSWLIKPDIGTGQYTVEVEGSSGIVAMSLLVEKPTLPTFGIYTGESSQLVIAYAGFQPNQSVTTLLYKLTPENHAADVVAYLKTDMDETGSARSYINWPPEFPGGEYWIFVPETIPDNAQEKALWGVPIFYSPKESLKDLTEDTYQDPQKIILRPSCGNSFHVEEGVLHLQYGFWVAKDADILTQTKDKIVVRLYVQGEEVPGYRLNKFFEMNEMPCGDGLHDGVFIFSETKFHTMYPLRGRFQEEIEVRVEFSFIDSITDGYDLFTPDTPITQVYTLRLAP